MYLMIIKEIVIIGEDGEPDGIRYDSVFTSLIKLVQEQQKEIDELRTLIGK